MREREDLTPSTFLSVLDHLCHHSNDTGLWRKIRKSLPEHYTIPDPDLLKVINAKSK